MFSKHKEPRFPLCGEGQKGLFFITQPRRVGVRSAPKDIKNQRMNLTLNATGLAASHT